MTGGEASVEPGRFEPDLGIVRLSRRQLEVLADLAVDRRAEVAHADVVRGLRVLGACGERGPHLLLRPIIDVITASRCRVWVRQWLGHRARVIELVCGPTAILVLPDGVDDDTPQDIRIEADPGGLAAVLAALIELSATRSTPSVPGAPIDWPSVRAVGTDDPPEWARSQLGGAAASIHDIRWRWTDGDDDWSILVLAHFGNAGWAFVHPHRGSSDAPGPRCQLEPVRSDEVWLALCGLARMALTGVEPAESVSEDEPRSSSSTA